VGEVERLRRFGQANAELTVLQYADHRGRELFGIVGQQQVDPVFDV
jgi:hypothetical protein